MPAPIAKYQFSIFEYNDQTNNSAATKAVKDCSVIFKQSGYQDHVLTFNNNSVRNFKFYASALKGICRFLWLARRGALVGIQYPMLNNVFKYFILLGQLKNIRFFCIVHDVESLRLGGKDKAAVKREAANFNFYDLLIVHNNSMKQWLIDSGVTTKMVPLGIFDYLADKPGKKQTIKEFKKTIVYAGNLAKSKFVYLLNEVDQWNFNIYGPNYQQANTSKNVQWQGVFSPEQIVTELQGDFGLIWDGDKINECDEVLGNYLKFNNPHKFSLYLAAGLPVIAPADSAIADIIKQHEVGILINNLFDLQTVQISAEDYKKMHANTAKLQAKVIKGDYFSTALQTVEKQLLG